MRDRSLDSLAPVFKPLAMELLARFVEAGIMICVVETRRSEEDHQADLASGHSWVERSKHQDGLAIDVAPYSIYIAHGDKKLNWDAKDPVWIFMGSIAARLGFTGKSWGGNWRQKDMGHFELPSAPSTTTSIASSRSSVAPPAPEPSAG